MAGSVTVVQQRKRLSTDMARAIDAKVTEKEELGRIASMPFKVCDQFIELNLSNSSVKT